MELSEVKERLRVISPVASAFFDIFGIAFFLLLFFPMFVAGAVYSGIITGFRCGRDW